MDRQKLNENRDKHMLSLLDTYYLARKNFENDQNELTEQLLMMAAKLILTEMRRNR